MSSLPLSIFQKISGLSDSAMLSLLRENRLRCRIDEKHGIMIEASESDRDTILRSMLEAERCVFEENESMIVERLSGVLADELERMCTAVLERLQGGTRGAS